MEASNSGGGGKENAKNGEKCCNNMRFLGDTVEEEEEEDDDDDNEVILKKKISSHPLYAQLIQAHLNCLKVGLGEVGEIGTADIIDAANLNQADVQPNIPSSSELDRFMEAYCITLKKLKEAMEEPLKGTASFIDEMFSQLRKLCETETNPNNPKPNSPAH